MPDSQPFKDLKSILDRLRHKGDRKISWGEIAAALGSTEQNFYKTNLKKNDLWVSQLPGLAKGLNMTVLELTRALFNETPEDQFSVLNDNDGRPYQPQKGDALKDQKIASLESLVRLQREEIEVLQRLLKYNKIDTGQEGKKEEGK